MRGLLLLALLLPMPALADDVELRPARHCAVDDRVLVAAKGARDGFRQLGRLPPASEYLTVFRQVDRCPAPVVVRSGIGAPRR